MRRAVVDNTVFVADLAMRGPGAAKLMDAWRASRFELITSEPILTETDNVLSARGVLTDAVRAYVAALRNHATIVRPTEAIATCRDPHDDKFLEAAIAGDADCIVTDDKNLRVVSPFRGIEIITTNRFLRRLGIRKPSRRKKRTR